MKKISLFILLTLCATVTKAQDITDALRYSTDATYGTARFNGLSGAFGALGGDMSSIGINPAGSAVFLDDAVSISLSVNDVDNKSTYFNSTSKSIDTDINLNQAGAVFIYNNSNEESPWRKFSIGVNFDNTKNLDNSLFIKGTSNTSVADFFVAQAQGLPLNELDRGDNYAFLGQNFGQYAQTAYLGYQGFIIDPLDPEDAGNDQYISAVVNGNNRQEFSSVSQGFNGKYTLNFATQYTDQFYFGINLNSHSINFERTTYLYEENSNAGSSVDQIGFENTLSVLGTGFSAQVGGIYKFENIRFGLTYDTPTWYTISEETFQTLQTRRILEEGTENINVYPNIINIYPDYRLKTPGKIAASTAVVFGEKGLISFDYSYKDFSEITFRPAGDPGFSILNTDINNSLKGASTYKLGGEYRLNNTSFRAGVRHEESPYENGETVGDLNGFSLGLGYKYKNYNFDFAYSRAEQTRRQQLYGNTNSIPSIDSTFSNLIFTLSFSI